MYHSELCAQLQQAKATGSPGLTEGGEEVSGQEGGLVRNLGNDELANGMIGSDKQYIDLNEFLFCGKRPQFDCVAA